MKRGRWMKWDDGKDGVEDKGRRKKYEFDGADR